MRNADANLADLFRGLVFYGTGGGGRADVGLTLLRQHFGAGYRPRFVDPATLDPEAYACATIVLGGRDPAEDVSPEERRILALPAEDVGMAERFARAVISLERATGQAIQALAVVELGSLAMAATLVAADVLGKVVLNADGTGRSIPQLGLAKLDLAGLAPAPAALVDRFGGETVVAASASAAMTDRIGRHLSRAVWGRGLACAAYLQPIRRFCAGLVAGSVDRATAVGRVLGGAAPASTRLADLLSITKGRLLFEGVATGTLWRSTEPFQFREFDYAFDGRGPDAGSKARIWVKNEHHMVWRDELLVASSPDPIAVLDATSLEPLTTLGDVVDSRNIVVVVVPSLDPVWRAGPGRSLLGPQRFGFAEAAVLLP